MCLEVPRAGAAGAAFSHRWVPDPESVSDRLGPRTAGAGRGSSPTSPTRRSRGLTMAEGGGGAVARLAAAETVVRQTRHVTTIAATLPQARRHRRTARFGRSRGAKDIQQMQKEGRDSEVAAPRIARCRASNHAQFLSLRVCGTDGNKVLQRAYAPMKAKMSPSMNLIGLRSMPRLRPCSNKRKENSTTVIRAKVHAILRDRSNSNVHRMIELLELGCQRTACHP
jgi:hypothetical protein